MNWAYFINVDSDALIFGLTDPLISEIQMSGVHCSCTSCFIRKEKWY